MSQFSEKLKALVEDSGLTIYQLAKSAALDRTTIQRSISGERLPGATFVEKLCDYLRVAPAERAELLRRHSICRIGEEVYAGRTYVQGIIEQIAGLHIYRNTETEVRRAAAGGIDMGQAVKVCVGQYSVNRMIRAVLEEEAYHSPSPCIAMAVPFTFGFLFDCLKQLYWESDGKLPIQHLVAFSKSPHAERNPNANLEILSQVLPFAFCMGSGYQPYYHYTTAQTAEEFVCAMPYYFYAGARLVTLSADFKTAALYNDPALLQVYQTQFQSSMAQSKPLVQQLSGILEMLLVGFDLVFQDKRVSHVIEPQPCFGKYYTAEMAEEYMRPEVPHREEMKARMLALYAQYRKFALTSKSFFTVAGLKAMAETGEMADLPQRFAYPFSVATRLYLLKSLREDIQSDRYYARAIDTSKIQISHIATTQIHDDQSVLFMATTDRGIVACTIREPSVCAAFLDFFESLTDSGLLYGKEDTLNILDEVIAQLEPGPPAL